MHWRGHATDMQSRATYSDLTAEVVAELAEQVEAALAAGIRRDRIALDPGFGFAKTGEHNWELLNQLDDLDALGYPILYGLSRKRFLGSLLAAPDGTVRPARERDDASLALTTLLAQRRVWAVRVHRVRPSVDAVAVVERLRRG
jgi:dihydropteroate synthase